jgi:TolA-binding protein
MLESGKRICVYGFAVVWVLAMPGCYGKRIYDVETRLGYQDHVILRLEDSLSSLESELAYLDSTFGGKSAPVRTDKAMTQSRLDEIQTRLEILESLVKENRYNISQISLRRAAATALSDTSASPGDTSMAKASVATHIYETAYIDFSRGDFEHAIEGFKDFVNRFPMTDFSDDAQSMIGQSYFLMGDYPNAIIEFR